MPTNVYGAQDEEIAFWTTESARRQTKLLGIRLTEYKSVGTNSVGDEFRWGRIPLGVMGQFRGVRVGRMMKRAEMTQAPGRLPNLSGRHGGRPSRLHNIHRHQMALEGRAPSRPWWLRRERGNICSPVGVPPSGGSREGASAPSPANAFPCAFSPTFHALHAHPPETDPLPLGTNSV